MLSFPGSRKAWWRMRFVCHFICLSEKFKSSCNFDISHLLSFSWEQESMAKNVVCLLKSTNFFSLQNLFYFFGSRKAWWRMPFVCHFMCLSEKLKFSWNFYIWLKHEHLLSFSWEQERVAENVACLLKSTKIFQRQNLFYFLGSKKA